ncbi:MAG: chemotaxis protein CheB [Desulfopila sp.]
MAKSATSKSATYQAVVIGVSAGGIAALEHIFSALDATFSLPIMVVQHIATSGENYLANHFSSCCSLPVREALDKEPVMPGTIYFAPPNYHLLIEQHKAMALSTQDRVNYSRPSIDVLFTTAAETYGEALVAIVLTGANHDGAAGLATVARLGGLTIVQEPAAAEVDVMPKAALAAARVDHVLPLDNIGEFLNTVEGNTTL